MGADPKYDIFVSYAHQDNEVPEGSSAKSGWVTALARNLNVGPNVHFKNIFIDHRLKPGDEFSDELIRIVRDCELLVVLLSQNYIESRWCGQELDSFVSAHGNDPDRPADVFVVELAPYESFTWVPATIQNLRKRLIHSKFWHQPPGLASPTLAGYPTPPESGPEGAVHYWRMLNELRAAVDSRLRARRASTPSVVQGPTGMAAESTQHSAERPLGTVLLADATEDLDAARSAFRLRLEPEGISVLPDGDYVGLAPREFEDTIAEDLRRSALFVQLLSPTGGRKVKGFGAPLPQLQFDRAVAAKLPIMQWCERLPQSGEIADPAHARLFQTDSLRATSLPAFQSEVIARLRELKMAQRKEQTGALERPVLAGKKVIFIDDLASEPALSAQVQAGIRHADCDIRSLPPGVPLGGNGIDIQQLLRPCRAGITIYADRTKFVTVYNRLLFFLNQMAEGGLALVRWGVYLYGGTTIVEFGIPSTNVVPVGEHELPEFLRGL